MSDTTYIPKNLRYSEAQKFGTPCYNCSDYCLKCSYAKKMMEYYLKRRKTNG